MEAADSEALVFEAADVLERVEEHGDLFAPVADLEQEIDIDGHKVTIGVKQYDS